MIMGFLLNNVNCLTRTNIHIREGCKMSEIPTKQNLFIRTNNKNDGNFQMQFYMFYYTVFGLYN